MCWICDEDAKSVALNSWQDTYGAAAAAALHYKSYDGFVADGVGDKLADVGGISIPLLILDDIPADTTTSKVLTVGGSSIVSTINTPGDEDWFKVELEAGKTYEFGQYQMKNGPSGIPLADAYLEIYDDAGNLLTAADGGGPFTPSGLDALLTYTAQESGTFYVNARAFDQVAEDGGDNGEVVGDYEVFARASTYVPYYDLDSPLHSLDWGSQFDGTSRNPDGDRGTRPDGLEVENKIGGKNVLYVYFARQGDVFVSDAADPQHLTATMVAKGMQAWEKDSFNAVFDEYEKVADLVYVETDNRYAADITVVTYNGTPGPGVSLLGRMSPPDEYNEGQTEYNAGDERWTEAGLKPGGFYFGTLIHEFGHGHGMSHPHDDGGRSSVMRGVEEDGVVATYTLGDFDLNQGVYTMMSYQDGWQLSPHGQAADDAGYGYIGSLMALDIAVIQDKYGVNEDWATGNDSYVMKDVNAAGTFYSSIWDGGGTDEIVYNGSADANIDLRPATLKYEYGGGGWISYADGIFGGFTIANGVTIENARSGAGDDTLTGNDAANMLDGGAGADRLQGGLGDDRYVVDNVGDKAWETADGGNDIVDASISYSLAGQYIEHLRLTGNAAINGRGNNLDNIITGNNAANILRGEGGADTLRGRGGDDFYVVENEGDKVFEKDGEGWDRVDSAVSYSLAGQFVEALTLTGSAATNARGNGLDNVLTGNKGANTLNGDAGADALHGGGGKDVLMGGAGADGFYFDTALGAANVDRIGDFAGEDTIYLENEIFVGIGASGAIDASVFAAGKTAADADDRIVYDSATGNIWFDADGSGAGAATLFATVGAGTVLTAADFYSY